MPLLALSNFHDKEGLVRVGYQVRGGEGGGEGHYHPLTHPSWPCVKGQLLSPLLSAGECRGKCWRHRYNAIQRNIRQVLKGSRNYPYLFIVSPRNEPRVFKGDSSKSLEKFETITCLVKCQICWILFSTKLSGYTSHRTVTGES